MVRVNADTTCNSAVVVEQGDTCFSIASSAHITVSQFKELNPGIDCDDLQIGLQVCLLSDVFVLDYI